MYNDKETPLSVNTTRPRIGAERQRCTIGNGYADGCPLAMVYSPYQKWSGLYTPSVALSRGCLFDELYLPFDAGNGKRCVQ